jgi:hypothetical protein
MFMFDIDPIGRLVELHPRLLFVALVWSTSATGKYPFMLTR